MMRRFRVVLSSNLLVVQGEAIGNVGACEWEGHQYQWARNSVACLESSGRIMTWGYETADVVAEGATV